MKQNRSLKDPHVCISGFLKNSTNAIYWEAWKLFLINDIRANLMHVDHTPKRESLSINFYEKSIGEYFYNLEIIIYFFLK